MTLVLISTNRLTMSPSTSPERLPETSNASPKTAAAGSAAPTAINGKFTTATPPREYDLLMKTVFSLIVIAAGLGLLFSWTGYAHKYAQVTEGWHLGETKLIEVTVVREDKGRLACSSDVTIEGLHCAYHSNGQPFDAHTQDDSQVLSPFNTIKNELFLGAGLWTSPALPRSLPTERFTVACNYKVLGVIKSVSLRWSVNGSFDPVKQSVTVGSLTDCVTPK